MAAVSKPAPPLIAIGVLSAPSFTVRREALRASWLRSSLVGRGKAVRVLFVVRAQFAPAHVECQLAAEEQRYDDIQRVAVAWNESRLRGPMLSLAAWLTVATAEFRDAPFVAKMDDDAYVHTPDLHALLQTVEATPFHTPYTYLGAMSWFHWQPKIFERSGFGWYFAEAWDRGRACRNQSLAERRCRHAGCGNCLGPFPFASGFLVVLSSPLAAVLAASAVLRRDLAELRAAPALISRDGRKQGKLMEDVWLGAVLHREPPAHAVRFVALSELDDPALVSDGWGLHVRPSALLVHIKGKQPERFLAVDDYMHGKGHCAQPQRLECEENCTAFSVNLAEIRRYEHPAMRRSRLGPMPDWRIEGRSFCAGTQQRATFCRLHAAPAQPSCRAPRTGLRGIDLLPRIYNTRTKPQKLRSHLASRKDVVLQQGRTFDRSCRWVHEQNRTCGMNR